MAREGAARGTGTRVLWQAREAEEEPIAVLPGKTRRESEIESRQRKRAKRRAAPAREFTSDNKLPHIAGSERHSHAIAHDAAVPKAD